MTLLPGNIDWLSLSNFLFTIESSDSTMWGRREIGYGHTFSISGYDWVNFSPDAYEHTPRYRVYDLGKIDGKPYPPSRPSRTVKRCRRARFCHLASTRRASHAAARTSEAVRTRFHCRDVSNSFGRRCFCVFGSSQDDERREPARKNKPPTHS
jgi:hypothetical protein